MTASSRSDKTPFMLYVIILVLPYVLFASMVPFVTDITINKDYTNLQIESQMELVFSIRNSSFPLFVPGFGMGHSSSALMLGQIFHPITHLASIMPSYWNGDALQWTTFLRMLSLGITHLILFVFLRRLRVSLLFSFLLSCIAVYNLRMLDLFRYGASESFTGHLLLCTAIGWNFISPSRLKGPLCIIGSTYWLVCSNHPQMMYYGIVGAGLFMLIAPFLLSSLLPEKKIDARIVIKFWLQTGLFLAAGILLSSAFILPFYFDFIKSNITRVGQTYAWAEGGMTDSLAGTINNFFLPFRTDIHSSFAGSSLFLIAVFIPVLRCFKVKVPSSIWALWGLTLLVFLYMQGLRTPVHRLVWEYLPFASSFRVAGRISLIMPILLILLLAWLTKADKISFSLKGSSFKITPFALLSIFSICLMAVYSLLLISLKPSFSGFSPLALREVPVWFEISVFCTGMAALMLLALRGIRPDSTALTGTVVCLLACIQITGVLHYGTWIEKRRPTPTYEQMQAQKQETLDYRYYAGHGLYSSVVETHLTHSFMEPFLGKLYTEIIPVTSQDEAYKKMLQNRTPGQLYLEGYEPPDSPETIFTGGTDRTGAVDLLYSSFNRLTFKVVAASPAFFGLSYPYTGRWKAFIDGKEQKVHRSNGAAHAVQIPKGEYIIDFRYFSPSAFWGAFLSCVALAFIGLYISVFSFEGFTRPAVALAAVSLSAGIFILWHHSLYNGDNLKTIYSWRSGKTSASTNLAYGKKTWTSSSLRATPWHRHSSRAVDGYDKIYSGFVTHTEKDPSLHVDLYYESNIKAIDLYKSIQGHSVYIKPHTMPVNNFPLLVSLSGDMRNWETVATVPADVESPFRLKFKKPQSARYIKIQAQGHGALSLDEVEVYGHEKSGED